jgi:NhaA family Na+:H+ antiporter
LLHKPVAFLVLPIFALANTAIALDLDWRESVLGGNGVGIIAGLALGKPIGILLMSYAVVVAGFCRLPGDLGWRHIFGAGLLGGVGFTMSIFIANLAFPHSEKLVNGSIVAVLAASLLSALFGYFWLWWPRPRHAW